MRKQLAVVLTFALGGCGALDPINTGTGGGASGTGDGNIDPGGSSVPDPGCGKQTFPLTATLTTPNVLLVVDESGSMQEEIAGTQQSKWDGLKLAVTDLLTKYAGQVNWGLSIFPQPGNGDSCAPGAIDLPVAQNNAQAVLSKITALTNDTIGGSTPTRTTLQAVLASGALNDPSHNNYVLLMTDGQPTCGGDGKVTEVVEQLYAATPSVRTFVVGFGDGTGSDPSQLNEWAVAGHTERMDATKYYQANNVADLTSAFAEIVAGVASCDYKLTQKPDDASLIVAYIDGQAVPDDPVNGTTYDAGSNSLVFHGTSCDQLKAGGAKSVDIIYGCPAPIIQ